MHLVNTACVAATGKLGPATPVIPAKKMAQQSQENLSEGETNDFDNK